MRGEVRGRPDIHFQCRPFRATRRTTGGQDYCALIPIQILPRFRQPALCGQITDKWAVCLCVQRYLAKKEEMPVMEQKPGRYSGVIGRQNLPLGKRKQRGGFLNRRKQRQQRFSFSVLCSLRALLFKIALSCGVTVWRTRPRGSGNSCASSPLWSEDFTAKLFCNVEFWLERLPKLIGLCEGPQLNSEFRV